MAGLQQSPLQKRDRRFESGSLQRRVTREPASGAPSWTTFTDRRGVANRIEPTRFQIVREIPPQRREPTVEAMTSILSKELRGRNTIWF
jgi:hypothetical protein